MLCPLLWESRWNIRPTSHRGEPLCLIYNAQRSYAARVYSSEVGKLALASEMHELVRNEKINKKI